MSISEDIMVAASPADNGIHFPVPYTGSVIRFPGFV